MRHQARHGETSKSTDRDAGIMVRESTYEFSAEPADEDSSGPRIVETNVTISQPTAQDTTEDQSIPLEIGTNISDWMPTGMLQNNAEFVTTCQHSNENFATWLFDSPGSQQQNFDLSNFLPYMDFGIDYCSPINDLWHLDSSNNAANPPVSDLSPTMVVTEPTFQSADQYGCNSHTRVSVQCRSRVVQSISLFLMKKRPPGMQDVLQEEDLLFGSNGRDLPNLTVKVLEDCLSSFWTYVAVQMPIIHQQTFSSDDCQLLLLLSILMLGAGQIVRLHPMKTRDSHRLLADLLAINLRWEIFPEAEPPITLWVAQSLLLLEFYEKMFSSRRLHERAYIHHASTLALLRRGSPMVGHAEDEEPPTRCPSPGLNMQQSTGVSKQLSWWRRWARNESWHRVVFAALQMDTLHAIAFGHESSLLPYEVRLPLPCDDALWSAQSPEDVWRLEETFLMHVFNPIVLFRLAFITTHIDILDAQVFAGYKRLLGRKITDKDYLGCSTRMRSWAMSNSSRLAVTHAFEFLDETLLRTNSSNGLSPMGLVPCRADDLVVSVCIEGLSYLFTNAICVGSDLVTKYGP
ncbi:hypothetical protein JADG_002974 [Aureobasidium aubasidani]|nr:hypothetical protein JADG_002974 [Aureobasidium pullulans]